MWAWLDILTCIIQANERMMIDFAMYIKLHPQSKPQTDRRDKKNSDVDVLAEEGPPPDDDSINLFPSALVGYNLRLKKWSRWSLMIFWLCHTWIVG